MKSNLTTPRNNDFAGDFLQDYRSPGIGKPLIGMAYGNTYAIIEFKNSYRVMIQGKAMRFNSILEVGRYINKKCYDPNYVFIPDNTSENFESNLKKKIVENVTILMMKTSIKPASLHLKAA